MIHVDFPRNVRIHLDFRKYAHIWTFRQKFAHIWIHPKGSLTIRLTMMVLSGSDREIVWAEQVHAMDVEHMYWWEALVSEEHVRWGRGGAGGRLPRQADAVGSGCQQL